MDSQSSLAAPPPSACGSPGRCWSPRTDCRCARCVRIVALHRCWSVVYAGRSGRMTTCPPERASATHALPSCKSRTPRGMMFRRVWRAARPEARAWYACATSGSDVVGGRPVASRVAQRVVDEDGMRKPDPGCAERRRRPGSRPEWPHIIAAKLQHQAPSRCRTSAWAQQGLLPITWSILVTSASEKFYRHRLRRLPLLVLADAQDDDSPRCSPVRRHPWRDPADQVSARPYMACL